MTLGEAIDILVGDVGCTRPQALHMIEAMKIAFEKGYEEGLEEGLKEEEEFD